MAKKRHFLRGARIKGARKLSKKFFGPIGIGLAKSGRALPVGGFANKGPGWWGAMGKAANFPCCHALLGKEPGRRRGQGFMPKPRTIENSNGQGGHNLLPVFPAMEGGKIVSANKPDKIDPGKSGFQCLDTIKTISGATLKLEIANMNMRVIGHVYAGLEAGAFPGIGFGVFLWIARADQPPHLIKLHGRQRRQRNFPMALMGWIEGASQKANIGSFLYDRGGI